MHKQAAGIVQADGELRFGEWNCRAGQNKVIIRTHGAVAPCFRCIPPRSSIDQFTFNREQLDDMRQACQKDCFSTLNHNLAYCYNDAGVIKWMWENVKRGFQGEVRSFRNARIRPSWLCTPTAIAVLIVGRPDVPRLAINQPPAAVWLL